MKCRSLLCPILKMPVNGVCHDITMAYTIPLVMNLILVMYSSSDVRRKRDSLFGDRNRNIPDVSVVPLYQYLTQDLAFFPVDTIVTNVKKNVAQVTCDNERTFLINIRADLHTAIGLTLDHAIFLHIRREVLKGATELALRIGSYYAIFTDDVSRFENCMIILNSDPNKRNFAKIDEVRDMFVPAAIFGQPLIGPVDDVTCPHVKVDGVDMRSDGQFLVSSIGEEFIVDQDSIVVKNNGFFICIDTGRIEMLEIIKELKNIRVYFTMILMAVSALCLFVTCVLFYVIPGMMTTSNVPLVALAAVMFCTNLVYLLGSGVKDDQTSCRIMAICIHFLWLSSFSQMSTLSISVYRRITRIGVTCNTKNTATLVLVTGFLLPALLIGCICMVNQFMFPKLKFYGDQSCFISNNAVMYGTFVAPIVLSVAINTVCYSMVVRYLFVTTNRFSRSKFMKTRRDDVTVALKLSSICGFGWFLGLVGILVDSDVVWFLFEIFSASQGIMISLGFGTNNKVYRFCCARSPKSTASENKTIPVITRN